MELTSSQEEALHEISRRSGVTDLSTILDASLCYMLTKAMMYGNRTIAHSDLDKAIASIKKG